MKIINFLAALACIIQCGSVFAGYPVVSNPKTAQQNSKNKTYSNVANPSGYRTPVKK